jgi:acyl-coenzyme A synthetase/AMP-(fatty) acid ligase
VVSGPFDEERLRRSLRATLAPYLVPVHVRIIDALPVRGSMKVDRARVAALFEPGDPPAGPGSAV